ncbi:hypothetical protein BU25DRAFT_361836 [Macroventuria anomochaeta]|uniref:Uncharacterized protein n=1 Tax=Macroventuria anomochaeta TaxID=301207 RepID=A0ACB6SB39_9PLEO|nr:uncharacterized protein BU25DRAFT_361836 [Macroventuria anomochaeta]KAF2630732.1 hypothetical protein BU25DRAFT_361836 [Macroventuria anomochaeta]
MLYSSVIVAVSALAGFAAAQNSTVIACCEVPVNNVSEDLRQSWCDAQENTCVDLCGGQGDIASNGNTCDASTLEYTCKCSNGTTIAEDTMKTYQQTVPAQMCYFWYDACINATINPTTKEGNAAQQFQCTQARDAQCGNTTIDESSSGSSSASASASGSGSASRTSAASGTGAAATGSSTAAASAGAAVANFALGTPALAGGLLAIFGLAL